MNERKITVGSRGQKGAALSKRKIAVGVVLIFLVAGSVWAWVRSWPDPQVEKVKQMQAEAFKEGATPEQRRASFDLIHKEMQKLSPSQRHEVGEQMRQTFERRMDQQVATYFALPEKQRAAYLDKQIKEMEKWRKEMDARRTQAGSGRGPGNAAGQPPPQNRTTDARALRRDQMLDRSTAQQRTMRSAYFADLNQRRTQLGLPPMGRGPR